MRISAHDRPEWSALFLLVSVTIAAGGCSRIKYRLQADRDAYDVIEERNYDPRWHADDYSLIRQFQLVPREATAIQDSIVELLAASRQLAGFGFRRLRFA